MLIGRARELAEISRQLSTSRLLTLVGLPGVGKSHLAAAAPRTQEFDEVHRIGLSTLRDAELLVPSLVFALRIQEQPSLRPFDLLVAGLRGRRVLHAATLSASLPLRRTAVLSARSPAASGRSPT